MYDMKISDSVVYVGVDDKDIDLFESQYKVPNGVTYNSYVILDEKIAVMDTVDKRRTQQWLDNLEKVLDGLSLGKHTLQFFMAPMVHWPEVMVEYEQTEKILFSADGFGKFGASDVEEDWDDEARRYFINIVGKYGTQVQALLKKAATLDIQMICPLHGPVLKEDLGHYIGKYLTWSSYEPEEEGVVVAFASIHGNTGNAARRMAQLLKENGAENVRVFDLARDDMAEAISCAFRYSRLVVMGVTYDGNLFPCMEDFLYHLKIKTYKKRKVGIVENGSWAPMAGKLMKAYFESMKDIEICEPVVTIKSVMKEADEKNMETLAKAILA